MVTRRQLLQSTVVLAAGAVACGRRQDAVKPAAPAGAPADLTWLMSENPKESGMEEVANAYNAAQQAITVTILPVGGNYEDKLTTMIAAGTPPDVARLNDDLVASYACRGNCRPIEEYLQRHKVKKDDFFSAQWRLPMYEGKTYAIISGYTPQVVWVNTEHFQRQGLKVPTVAYKSNEWTWEDFLAAARRLTGTPGADGQPQVFGTSTMHAWYGYWVWGNGGDVLSPDRKRFGLSLPTGYEALQWESDLVHKHRVAVPLPYMRQPGNSVINFFVNGRIAMLCGGGNWATFRAQITGFNWDIVPYPKGKVRRGHTTTPLLFMIPTGTKYPDQGFTFLLHLVSDEAQKIIAAKGFRMPPKKAQANSNLFLRPELPPKNQRLWLDAQEGALEEPQIPQRLKLRQTYRPKVDRVRLGEETAREAMQFMEAQCNAVLQEPCT